MSQFHRSGHTRTNSNGTTFWVRDHKVGREDWQQNKALQQTHVYSQYSQYGITYPNAKCPVCGDSVFFFQAHNGGRVFFDPPLGSPWHPHPCTTREPDRAKGVIKQITDNANYYDTSINAESYTFSLFPRPKGTIVTIYGEEEELTFITPLKLNKKLLDRVWVTKDDDDKIVGLSFLTIDFEPIEVPARLRKEASNLSLRLRKELSQLASHKIKEVAKRINGKLGEIIIYETNYGSFGVLIDETSRILIIPVPINHLAYTEEEELTSLRRYMAGAVNTAREKIRIKTPIQKNRLNVDRILFAVDDILGCFENHISSDLGFYEEGFYNGSIYTVMNDPLEDIRARLIWVDALEHSPIQLPDNSIRLEEVYKDEADFCVNFWPDNTSGRWVKLQAMISIIGFTKLFKEITSTLKKLGWRMSFGSNYFDSYTYEIVYLEPNKNHDDASTISIRFLFSRSSDETGLTIAAGYLDDAILVKDVLYNVKGSEDMERVTRDISRSKPRKKKPL